MISNAQVSLQCATYNNIFIFLFCMPLYIHVLVAPDKRAHSDYCVCACYVLL